MPEPEFVAGGQSEWLSPREVAAWRLPFRFAVVQHTYRPDLVDMHFDKAVWLRLFELAQGFSEGNPPTIVDRLRGATGSTSPPTEKDEEPIEAYLVASEKVPDDDWYPPERVIVREDGAPVLVIAAEYWANVGGPKLYHDSLTYSILSKENLATRVMQFLTDAAAAARWDLARVPIPAPDPPPTSFMDKFFSWLGRHA